MSKGLLDISEMSEIVWLVVRLLLKRWLMAQRQGLLLSALKD
jgi:hypothetical protein